IYQLRQTGASIRAGRDPQLRFQTNRAHRRSNEVVPRLNRDVDRIYSIRRTASETSGPITVASRIPSSRRSIASRERSRRSITSSKALIEVSAALRGERKDVRISKTGPKRGPSLFCAVLFLCHPERSEGSRRAFRRPALLTH